MYNVSKRGTLKPGYILKIVLIFVFERSELGEREEEGSARITQSKYGIRGRVPHYRQSVKAIGARKSELGGICSRR